MGLVMRLRQRSTLRLRSLRSLRPFDFARTACGLRSGCSVSRPSTAAVVWRGLLALAAGFVLLGGCTAPQPPPAMEAVKIVVDADGLYEVTAAALAEAGFDLAGADEGRLSLTAGGAPIPFELAGTGRSPVLRFQGLRMARDAYTPHNVYWLRSGAAAGGSGGPEGPRPSPTVTPVAAGGAITATVRLEEDWQYDSMAVDAVDRWYWQTLFAPAKLELTVALPDLAPGTGALRAYVIAKSSAPVDPDHRLLILVNDTFVSDAPWDGAGPHLVTATIPEGVLVAGENKLRIEAPGDTGALADSVQLHWIEIDHPLAVDAAAAPEVRAAYDIRPPATSTLPDWPGGADLLIVTVPQFRDALAPLVAARAAQGLRVAVMDVEQVYDAFTHGRTDPAAIQALVRHAAAQWTPPAPRYLLLAGDASYDPLGLAGGTEADLVPTRSVYTAFSGWTGSDVWYALPDDGPTTLPALAVGRFPAQTAGQLAAMVEKTLSYEAQGGDLAWRTAALMVADNDEPGFADETRAFAEKLTPYRTQQVVVDEDGSATRSALQDAFRDGTGLIGYFGHGSITLWAQEKVFSVDDVSGLENAERLPIVFTVTCLSGFFEHPATVSLGEALLRRPGGGAVAALVPSSAAVLNDQRLLALGLADALAQEGPAALGDRVLQAQRSLPPLQGGVRDILLTFNLLGDPAMQIAR